MENYVICNDFTGEIVMTGNGPVGIASQQIGLLPDTEVVVGHGDMATDYVKLDGVLPEIRPRPFVPSMYPATGAAPMTLAMTGFPAGFSVTATNEAGESVSTSDPADPIILADPEIYTVTIDPPWPYLPETLEIEVT